jgi:hypothetical protein
MIEKPHMVEVSLAEAKARMGVSIDGERPSRRGSLASRRDSVGKKGSIDEKIENIEASEETVMMPDFTEEDKKRIMRKIDFRLVPMLAVLYLVSFLDRGNSES